MYGARPCRWMDTLCSRTVSIVLLVLLAFPIQAQEEDPSVNDPVRQHGDGTPATPEELEEAHREFMKLLAAVEPDGGDSFKQDVLKDLKITLLDTPNDAVQAATADLMSLKAFAEQNGVEDFDTTVYRYVWVPDANPEDLALVSFVLNSAVSRSDINYTPNRRNSPIQFVANNKLVRVNLSVLCPLNQQADLLEVQGVWDKMFNPYFILEKQESTRKVTKTIDKKVSVDPYVADDGKTYDFKIEKVEVVTEEKIFEKSKVFGPHIDVDTGAMLKTLTAAENPIVWCHTLYQQALTTADGGLYYEFMGIREAPKAESGKKQLSDQDFWLASLGVSEQLIDQLRADQRVAITRSNVTAKSRRMDIFNRPSRSSNNQGIIMITQDPSDADYRAAADPILNLLDFDVFGREIIFERNNGHLGYILYDGNGVLVDEAPPELVADHTIPAPNTRRLQSAISCIRCHGKGEDQGWKPIDNDIRKIMNGFMNVYNDQKGATQNLTLPETLEKLARLYSADLEKPFRRAREDHMDAIARCTVGVVTKEDKSPWSFKEIADALSERFVYYSYSPVTPLKACREMGYEVEDEEAAVTLFNRLVGFLNPEGDTKVVPEDIRLGFLKTNTPINRSQWELVYIDAMTRATVNSQQLKLAEQKEPAKQEPEAKQDEQ